MKVTMVVASLILGGNALAQNKPITHDYKVDPSGTTITYVGKKVTGSHTGNVQVKSGNLVVQNEELISGEIVVDMNTITSTDITDAEYNQKYVNHMKSEDFFNTSKHPEAKLTIKDSKKTAKGLNVSGLLTFNGKTNPVDFIVTDIKNKGDIFRGKSNLVLDRTKWGLKYGSGSFFKGLGDKAIDNNFTLAIDLLAKK